MAAGGKKLSFWSPAVVAFSMALSTPVTTAFFNCLPIAEFAAFLKFSFVTFSAIVLPTVELMTFFAIPDFTTFLAKLEFAALFTADVITFLANAELAAFTITSKIPAPLD